MNWEKINDLESKKLWDKLESKFRFNPSFERSIFSIMKESKRYSTSSLMGEHFTEEINKKVMDDLKLLLSNSVEIDQRMIALCWKSDSYLFNPRGKFELDEFGEWLVPALPNGDLTFFLDGELENGVFGDGINEQMVFFGDRILDNLKMNPDLLFHKLQSVD